MPIPVLTDDVEIDPADRDDAVDGDGVNPRRPGGRRGSASLANRIRRRAADALRRLLNGGGRPSRR